MSEYAVGAPRDGGLYTAAYAEAGLDTGSTMSCTMVCVGRGTALRNATHDCLDIRKLLQAHSRS